MKVIEFDSSGKPTGWQQGKNKMFLEKYDGGHFYLIEKPLQTCNNGTENVAFCKTFSKFKEAKKSLYEKV